MQEKVVVAQRKLFRMSKNKSIWTKSTNNFDPSFVTTNLKSAHMDVSSTSRFQIASGSLDTQRRELSDTLPPFISRSIIPDPLGELPAWFKKESELAAANMSTFRIKYPLHNPVGPRWYHNHHLIPPAQLNPGIRPPSFFSNSFPPMTPATSHDRSEETTRLPGPSRTPSGSHLPTPSSSQIRVLDVVGNSGVRKASQGNVDILDVSDPWGACYHNPSPYDAGSMSNLPVGNEETVAKTRSRLSSMNTAHSRRIIVTPSPLSQSTSALHLQASEPIRVSRKLSKRHKPIFGRLFGHNKESGDTPSQHTSSPVMHMDHPFWISDGPQGNSAASKQQCDLPSTVLLHPNTSTSYISHNSVVNKQQRRGSVLGRLVRKFSILKKTAPDSQLDVSEGNKDESRQGQVWMAKPSEERRQSDPIKRVPPPSVGLDLVHREHGDYATETNQLFRDYRASLSFEAPFPARKLTIANPDTPSSGGTTPIRATGSLPLDDPLELMPESQQLSEHDPSTETIARKISAPKWEPSRTKQAPTTPHQVTVSGQQPPVELSHQPSDEVKTLQPSCLPSAMVGASFSSLADDSPLSKASILANPPTPYNSVEPSADLPPVGGEIIPSHSADESYHDACSTKITADDRKHRLGKSISNTSRMTETFRLVRTLSDHVPSLGETIVAEGEQWAVVNSSPAPRRSDTNEKSDRVAEKTDRAESIPSKNKDRKNARREKRRTAAEVSAGGDQDEHLSAADSKSLKSSARSLASPQCLGSSQPTMLSYKWEVPSQSRNEEREPEISVRRSHSSRPATDAVAHIERLPSTSARPTSELPIAGMNVLRAREIWEMQRLWKGRSMYHGAAETNMINTPTSKDSRSVIGGESMSMCSLGHGSSHTSYVVQTPFQAHPIPANVFYANMPTAPPPLTYGAPSPQSSHASSSHCDYPTAYRSVSNGLILPSEEVRPPNPLPAPPRESTYQPNSPSIIDPNSSGSGAEYWTNKYTSVPATR